MSQPFLPHSDGTGHAVVIGAKSASTKVAPLGSGAVVLVAWSNGPGYVQLGGSGADATAHDQSIYFPVEAGMITLRRGPDHSHIAWDGIDLHAVMGDGL